MKEAVVMNRKALSLFVMGLMLFSVFLVAKPASAQQSVPGDTLKIVQLAAQGSLFMGVFNPSPSGMTDVYTVRVWYFLHDPSVVMGPDAQYHNYRCELVSIQYNVKVPDDAVIWNGTQKQWVSPYAGKTAKSAVTWKCGLGTWVDGQKITLADYLFDYAMAWEWAYQDGKDDKFYSEDYANNLQGTLQLVMGLKVDKVTDDYIEYTLYQNYVVPYDKWSTAIGNFMEKPSFPWELYNVMSNMVAYGVNGKEFSWSTQPQNGYQLDMISPEQAPYFKAEAQKILSSGNLIPVWLSTLKPVLQKWGISEEQAGITEDMAKQGYNDIIKWADEYKNVLISDGPYYVEKYDPKAMTVVLKLADNKRIGFAGEVNGKPIPWNPNWKEIDIYGTLNKDTAILAVAKGEYDFYWYATPYSDIAKVMQQYGKDLNPIKTISVWWSLDLNLVGDPQTGLVNSSGTEKFNPFALRGVRYAMNWLVNRQYIVSQILQGSGAPMFGPEVSGQVDAYMRIMTVAKALGFTPQGDENYALKLIDQAMNNAAQALAKKGYKLEKKDGIWYFNGEPVTVKVIARVEDQRLDEGKYIAQILQKAGFKVELLQWQRTQASKVVYGQDPRTLQWHVYTEGWVSSGIQSVTSIAWDFWFFDYYVDPNWATNYHNPMTVQDLVNTIAGGDLNKFISTLQLKYYNTPDKLKPLLKWTGYDLAMVLAYNSWKGPNNETISIDTLDQFWDLYKLAYGTHMLNSPRVYTVETWNFFLTNKKITVTMPDPISGLGSFLAARSVVPTKAVSATTTTTSTTKPSSTTTTTSKPTTTTSKPTTSSAPTSTTSTSGKSGICGPAFIVGLAVLPLLLRKRR
ncbi:ABC transporter substrate-binding protein [Thermococcus sp.]|uniref:ABC transporter substrate-binding protein n=1 Tax=Thermococcus sp. TaxID=35749 RepID=UPI00261D6FC6|nr:ABC transporter substrate-binding protein [Thermococcus sp.]